MKRFWGIVVCWGMIMGAIQAQNLPLAVTKSGMDGKFPYEFVQNDPIQARIYTLKNGLKVFLAPNQNAGPIAMGIVVGSGSVHDPSGHSGLAWLTAHLLEGGTDRMGTLDWEQEKPLLEARDAKLAELADTQEPSRREALIAEIADLQTQIGQFSTANEYAAIGRKIGSTLDHVQVTEDYSSFMSSVSPGGLEAAIKLHSEMFRNPVMRDFPNILQKQSELLEQFEANGYAKATETAKNYLFQEHRYGNHPVLGKIEEFAQATPALVREFYSEHYAANNMAICLSGRFETREAIRLIEQYFGYFQRKTVVPYRFNEESPKPPQMELIAGPFKPQSTLIFRTPNLQTKEGQVAEFIYQFLKIIPTSPSPATGNPFFQAGGPLIQHHRMKDYGLFMLTGVPGEGETPESLEPRLLQTLEFFKLREIEENLLPLVLNRWKQHHYNEISRNESQVLEMMEAFAFHLDWADWVNQFQFMSGITLDDIMRVSGEIFADEYITIVKQEGPEEGPEVPLMPKWQVPSTSKPLNSPFGREFNDFTAQFPAPHFIDFEKEIKSEKVDKSMQLFHLDRPHSPLFRMEFIWPVGATQVPLLPLAASFFNAGGTENIPPDAFAQLLWESGGKIELEAQADRTILHLSGLHEQFGSIVRMAEDKLRHLFPDPAQFEAILPDWEAAKDIREATSVEGTAQLFLRYGSEAKKLLPAPKDPTASSLVEIILQLSDWHHDFYYAGPASAAEVSSTLREVLTFPWKLLPLPAEGLPGKRAANADTIFYLPNMGKRPRAFFTYEGFPDFDTQLAMAKFLAASWPHSQEANELGNGPGMGHFYMDLPANPKQKALLCFAYPKYASISAELLAQPIDWIEVTVSDPAKRLERAETAARKYQKAPPTEWEQLLNAAHVERYQLEQNPDMLLYDALLGASDKRADLDDWAIRDNKELASVGKTWVILGEISPAQQEALKQLGVWVEVE